MISSLLATLKAYKWMERRHFGRHRYLPWLLLNSSQSVRCPSKKQFPTVINPLITPKKVPMMKCPFQINTESSSNQNFAVFTAAYNASQRSSVAIFTTLRTRRTDPPSRMGRFAPHCRRMLSNVVDVSAGLNGRNVLTLVAVTGSGPRSMTLSLSHGLKART